MSFLQRIEDKPALALLTMLATGFAAGFGANVAIQKAAKLETVRGGSYTPNSEIRRDYVPRTDYEQLKKENDSLLQRLQTDQMPAGEFYLNFVPKSDYERLTRENDSLVRKNIDLQKQIETNAYEDYVRKTDFDRLKRENVALREKNESLTKRITAFLDRGPHVARYLMKLDKLIQEGGSLSVKSQEETRGAVYSWVDKCNEIIKEFEALPIEDKPALDFRARFTSAVGNFSIYTLTKHHPDTDDLGELQYRIKRGTGVLNELRFHLE